MANIEVDKFLDFQYKTDVTEGLKYYKIVRKDVTVTEDPNNPTVEPLYEISIRAPILSSDANEKPINYRIVNDVNLNKTIDQLISLIGTKCDDDDIRLSNSRRCNNTFDNIETAKQNLLLHKVATSGNYSDLENKPNLHEVATTGNYSDLENKPNLHKVATTGKYTDLEDIPEFHKVAASGDYNDLENKPELHKVATSGKYSDLTGRPDIPDRYEMYQMSFYAALAGFSSLNKCSNSSDTITKTLNYKKKYCFVGYGGYTAGMVLEVSGGTWMGASLDFASNFIVIPTYTGSMAGSSKNFYFITSQGIYNYRANGNDITVRLSRPDCYAYGEQTLYSY